MNRTIAALLTSTSSSSIEEKMQTVFQIAMLLEKNTRPSDENGFYEAILPREVLDIDLDEEAQTEILQRLVKNINTSAVAASVVWAIGKALPKASAPVLIKLLRAHPNLADDPLVTYQAVVALENCLDYDREEESFRRIEQLLKNSNVVEFLRHASSADDPKLAEHAPRLLRRLTKSSHGL